MRENIFWVILIVVVITIVCICSIRNDKRKRAKELMESICIFGQRGGENYLYKVGEHDDLDLFRYYEKDGYVVIDSYKYFILKKTSSQIYAVHNNSIEKDYNSSSEVLTVEEIKFLLDYLEIEEKEQNMILNKIIQTRRNQANARKKYIQSTAEYERKEEENKKRKFDNAYKKFE